MIIWVDNFLIDDYFDDLNNYLVEVEEAKKDVDFSLHIFEVKNIKVFKSIHNIDEFDFNKEQYCIFTNEDDLYKWCREEQSKIERKQHIEYLLSQDN